MKFLIISTVIVLLIILFLFVLTGITACSQKIGQLNFDSRGRIIAYTVGKQDTIYFSENSSKIDSTYAEALTLMSQFIISNKHKIYMHANTHEQEKESITEDRINEIESYLLGLGLKKEQILKNYKRIVLPLSDEQDIREREMKEFRRVILQIVE
ncbi:MAG TPA: hypothetical protein PLE30_05810 [Candidatus Kapabacteria bacterium]|nr:hypothetical protein [Candidatus Kapabacteria bacterium]